MFTVETFLSLLPVLFLVGIVVSMLIGQYIAEQKGGG